mgnify:CR=1 FL=1
MPKFNLSKFFDFKGIIAAIAGLSMLVGSVLGVHAYFAKEREFKAYIVDTDRRLAEADTKLLIHQAEQSKSYVQEKVWKLRDRVEQKPSDIEAKQQLRELEDEKAKLDTRINDLKAGKK